MTMTPRDRAINVLRADAIASAQADLAAARAWPKSASRSVVVAALAARLARLA